MRTIESGKRNEQGSAFWDAWDRAWARIPGTKSDWFGPVVDARSMNLGVGLFVLLLLVVAGATILGVDVSSENPIAQLIWVALLLILGILGPSLVARGRGIRR